VTFRSGATLDLAVLVFGSGGYRFTFVNKSQFPREASGEEMRLEVVRGRAHSMFSLRLGGLAPKILQEILGRARITLTLHSHSHVLPDTQEGAVEAVNEVLRGGSQWKLLKKTKILL